MTSDPEPTPGQPRGRWALVSSLLFLAFGLFKMVRIERSAASGDIDVHIDLTLSAVAFLGMALLLFVAFLIMRRRTKP